MKLSPLEPEGGFYSEAYRAKHTVPAISKPDALAGKRSAGTAIYYLLTADTFSAFHRLKSDEVYHFYLGDPVELFILGPKGKSEKRILGDGLRQGMRPQAVVPKGHWQGARLRAGGKWALLGTTVFPGFEFRDFELGDRGRLLKQYPKHKAIIIALTKEPG